MAGSLDHVSGRVAAPGLPLLKWRMMQEAAARLKLELSSLALADSYQQGDGRECHPTDPSARAVMARG